MWILSQLHAIACCLKAVCTADAAAAIEECRRACGGHGYMSSSNFPASYGMVTAAETYEGENTVLYLQTARYWIYCYFDLKCFFIIFLAVKVVSLIFGLELEHDLAFIDRPVNLDYHLLYFIRLKKLKLNYSLLSSAIYKIILKIQFIY